MTQGDAPYPPDEFDAVDPSDGPLGAHRRPRSAWATLWPYGLVLLVSALLALVLVGVLWDERDSVPIALPGLEAPGDAAPDPVPTDGTATATPTDGPAPDGTAGPTGGGTPSPAARADPETPVRVLNSTSVAGLAGVAAETLRDAGWSDVEPGNFTGTLPRSTVRYGEPDLEASARAVAEVLGIAVVEASDDGASGGIEVVLESDFAG